jgi:two-component system CitB family response regulator
MRGAGTPSAPWQVLVVEDDPAVAYVHRALIARTPGFEVSGVVSSAEDAAAELARSAPDLLLLDLTLRGMNGVDLMRRLRAAGNTIEFIAVTASRSASVVRSLVHLGAVDYLVKPFPPERLQQALVLFRERMAAISGGELTQQQVDEVTASGRTPRRWIPKGLSSESVERVRSALQACEAPVTADELARRLGMARVTTRRYLEYLVTTQQATVTSVPHGPGRPRKTYRATALRPSPF